MKIKLKKWFQKNKDKIFIWICVGLIFLVVFLIVLFKNSDEKNLQNNKADISLVDDSNNLNKSWSINNDGNLVGDNLCSNIVASGYVGDYYMANILPNTTYSIKAYGMTPNILNYGVYLYLNGNAFFTIAEPQSYNTRLTNGITFTTPSSGYPSTIESIYIKVQYNIPIENVGNVMINLGNEFLEWEPYGLWYSQTNYNNYGDVKYSEGSSSGYDVALADIYSNNPFYNAILKYYSTLDSSTPWFTTTIENSLLQNSNTLDVNQVVKSVLNENDQQSYYDDQSIGYFKIDFVKSFSASEMEYLVNATNPYQFDHYFTYYFDDGSEYVFHNSIESEYSNYYWQYDVSLANTNKNGQRVVGISFRKGARDIVNSVSQSQYNIGYNDGYSSGYDNGYDNGSTYGYNNGYNVGKADGYANGFNVGSNQEITTNGFKILFNSILSYPINFISSVFNFEFMGINVASVVLFLVSIGVVLFVIKRLWK